MPKKADILKYIYWANRKLDIATVLISCDLKINIERLIKRGVPDRMKSFERNQLMKIIENQEQVVLFMGLHIKQKKFIDSGRQLQENIKNFNEEF
ncbi:hypothetical protein N8666_00440 [bacterium]|nr:hypothetical protein [bacterium]